MLNKCLKRILISIPVLIGVVLIIFIMLRIIPGNPVTTMLGEHVNQAVIDKVSREMGLDQPLYIQFFRYVANAFQGDFGTSYRLNRNVTGIILEAFPNTVKLSVCAAVVAWIIGIVAGIVAAVKQNRLLDRLFMGCALLGVSMPVFMTALVLQYVFAFKLKLFPVSGYDSLAAMVELGGKHCPHDALQPGGGHAGGLHSHGQGQGASGMGRHCPSRPEERHAARGHHDGAAGFQHAVRRRADRERIRYPGNRTPGCECH